MKKQLTEEKRQKLTEGLFDWMWRMNMRGKKKTLIKMFDGDPQVAKALEDLEKATDNLKKSLDDSEKLRNTVDQLQKKI